MTEKVIHILLIEDNEDDALLLKRMFDTERKLAFTIVHQATLPQAMAALDRKTFDLILLDLSLPSSQGLDTFTFVHSRASTLPIIVLTGLADEEMATLALRLGAQDYLVKGQINRQLIVRAIRYAIERKHIEKKMITYQNQLRSLTSQLALTEERERRQIATELHDHIGQNLAIAKLKLGMLQKSADAPPPGNPLQEIHAIIEQAIGYTRSLSFELSPPLLYEADFQSAVEWLGERIGEQHKIQVKVSPSPLPTSISNEVRVLLFHAVRELLYNVVKHADSSKAVVSMGQEAFYARITVEDHGNGFDPAHAFPETARPKGFGLFNIRERLTNIGGELIIDSQPDHGTRVTLLAPLKTSSLPDQA